MFDHIAKELDVSILRAHPVRGGDVAISYRLELSDGRSVFAKTHTNPPAGFFSTEAAGLRWLREPGAIRVPQVLAVSDEPPYLVLEWIEEGRAGSGTEHELGRALAALHQAGAHSYGREDRRTTGSRGLPNEPCSSWVEFYASQRLLPLARLARDAEALSARSISDLEQVAARLDLLGGDPEPPVRLHGDLWGGNRLVGVGGQNWLIDPAAHGGHREFDLAMMRLFGGFGAECFDSYREAFPLSPGWQQRIDLHQLAPLVVHAIKFGGGYAGSVERALSRYQ